MFNIKKLAIASTAKMTVKDPKGAPVYTEDEAKLPLSITLKGPGTRVFVAAKHKFDEKQNELTVLRMKGGTVPEGATEQARAEFFATVTESFDNFEYPGTAGYESYKAAYLDADLDLAEQVNVFLGDRGNFFNGLPKPSSNSSDTSHG